ncbi:hypothetical protein H8356DRAFT_1702628 [Neocallimastix lanati (nom. inval.)]|jgi:hypothetical protein|uniref:Apple domain-containing protein n=1 Tax=Neocallimastix californiae TaxID=1754190 RepID=A0A1Y2BK59_9FUNG|nr:hypothetical protein H8356DRAFT_1702628 [Neocallimastix sp. JGI-2020a]ORY34495.1 hypothetical protein LY90DRAFT_673209 [Neocallimastix californiae]|eukprot:ORY34495.1 hypothetical protein LY90DRAFT_673209 [Neocallimastix californiae]
MTVQFTENNNKKWVFYQGKYLNANEDSTLLLSDDTEKILKDCINSCATNDKCLWFSWSTEGGKCRQYKFLENNESTFQWRYDNFKYQGAELPTEVFNLEHDTESQEQCLGDCYNDTNCVAVNYIQNTKKCRIFYNYSNPNTYFGYYAVNENGDPNIQGGEPISAGDDIYNVEAKIENNSIFSLGNIIIFLSLLAFIAFSIYMAIQYKKNNEKKGKKLPELPPRV